MKTLTRAALAAALIAGTSSIAFVMPAEAKKKDEAPAGPKVSAELRPAIIAAQTALTAKDFAAAETSIATVEAGAKTDDERYFAQIMRLQLEANKLGPNGNDATLAGPIDALLANPATPKTEVGRFSFMRANISYNAKQYPAALAGYQKAKDLGYVSPTLGLMLARTKILGGDAAGGAADIEAIIAADKAAGKKSDEDLYKYTITALQKTTDVAATQRWTREWLYAYPTQKNWHTAIFVFGFQGANQKVITKRERVDLFRLLRATGSLAGESEYLEYADLAVEIGVATESQSVIKEGKASNKIAATNANVSRISADAAAQLAKEGSAAAQEKSAAASPNGLSAAGTGDFYLGNGNYAKAIEMYKLALTKGGDKLNVDEVNTHLGIAYLESGDKASAKTAFALVKNGLRTQIAQLWTTWADAPGVPTAG
ncbi:tetratricopeptide repeat protein [Sphingomonas sp. GB1N7]|uniref:tetratricopeptide repeat protein n=1 Tax=Parasphingomonas caseinilytica TaxID=3096158 RepID=UPI002FC637DD